MYISRKTYRTGCFLILLISILFLINTYMLISYRETGIQPLVMLHEDQSWSFRYWLDDSGIAYIKGCLPFGYCSEIFQDLLSH